MICEQVKKLTLYMKTQLDNKLRKYNLTATQFIVLEYLVENEGESIIQKDICELLEIKHTTVVGIIKRLEEKGLITRTKNKQSKIINISQKGRELYNSLSGRRYDVENILLDGFTQEEIQDMEEKLNKMYLNIREYLKVVLCKLMLM